jgi:hypothetical protein
MHSDVENLKAIASAGKDVVLALAAIAATVTAILGLTAWRRQLMGNVQYELARRYLLHVYRFRDAFKAARAPGVWIAAKGQVDERARSEGLHKAFDIRVSQLDEAWSKLQLEAQEAEVLWGEPATAPVRALNDCRAEFYAALWHYFWLNDSHEPWQTVDRSTSIVQETEEAVYSFSGNPARDHLLGRLLQAVSAAEDVVRPHLRRQ